GQLALKQQTVNRLLNKIYSPISDAYSELKQL
nr:RecName: Full=Hemocyanin subunit 2 [Maja squinado]